MARRGEGDMNDELTPEGELPGRHVLSQSCKNGTCSKTIGNLKPFPLLRPKLLLRSLPDLRSGIWRVYENTLLSIPERLSALFLINIAISLRLGFLQLIKIKNLFDTFYDR